jgi:hypothetical protein
MALGYETASSRNSSILVSSMKERNPTDLEPIVRESLLVRSSAPSSSHVSVWSSPSHA